MGHDFDWLPDTVVQTDRRGPSDYWRLSEVLTIDQASLLIVGRDPQKTSVCRVPRPDGFNAVQHAITCALESKVIDGTLICWDGDGSDIPNPEKSKIQVESLRRWLSSKGFGSGFFFPNTTQSPDYLDPSNANYSQKLAAAVHAWGAVATDPKYAGNGKSVKQNLEVWLTAHAAQFDLIKEDGEINVDAIKNQIAKVANWQDRGGAPKTPTG